MTFELLLIFSLLSSPSSDAQASNSCTFELKNEEIPVIRASTHDRAWYCLGFLQGRHRGWQMDFLRRATQGRLSEVLGPEKLKADLFLRLIGLRRIAERLGKELSPQATEIFDSFRRGVTEGFKVSANDPASKIRHFNLSPEAWTVQDSLSILLLQSFFQTKRTFEEEINAKKAEVTLGQPASDFFDQRRLSFFTSVIRASELPTSSQNFLRDSSFSRTKSAAHRWMHSFLGLEDLRDLAWSQGSNSFVVSGKLTASGHPIVGNDPHLELRETPFFFWVEMSGPDFKISGASLPGAPAFAMGTNGKTAWGLTNAFFDAADLYIVKESELKGRTEEFRPSIHMKVGPFQIPFSFKSLQRTREGYPILPIEIPGIASDERAILFWTGYHLKGSSFDSFVQLPFNSSAKEIDAKIKHTDLTNWHIVYADDQGNIGYRLMGLVIRKTSNAPFDYQHGFPKPEFLSDDEKPGLMNPSRGFIVTANNAPWPAAYHLQSGFGHEPSFRAFRIEELIQQRTKHDLQSLHSVQCDTEIVDARFLLPLLRNVILQASLPMPKIDLPLRAELDCQDCLDYELWMHFLVERLNAKEADLIQLLEKPSEIVRKAVIRSLQDSQAFLNNHRRLNPSFKWSDLHRNDFLPLGANKLENPKRFLPTAGGEHSVNLGQSVWMEEDHYLRHLYGPAHRVLFELGKETKILWSSASHNLKDFDSIEEDPTAKTWQACGAIDLAY